MVILTVGLNHTTAPVEIRERLHLSGTALPPFFERLVQEGGVNERLVLSTCNRVEVYAVTENPEHAQVTIPRLLAEGTRTPLALFEDRLYWHRHDAAVRHAFRVAASLDSLVLGESQILSQVKAAYEVARAQGVTGPILNTLMTRSLGVAKKVRTETGIGEAAVSIPSAAIGLAKTIFGELSGRTVHILGAGEMAEVAVRHLRGEGVQADIVLSSTAAPHHIVHRADVEELIRLRRNRPLFLIDIAVPRDIDPAVNEIDNVYLYDIDDLEGVVAGHRLAREREAEQAELLIDREVASFLRWLKSLEVVPTLVMLRRHLEEIREAELAKALSRLPGLTPAQQDVVRTLAHGIINKVLHHPTTELKRQSVNRDGLLYVSALRRLFGLQDDD